MSNTISIQLLHGVFQSALKGEKITCGADYNTNQIGPLRQFYLWLLNLLSYGEVDTRIGEQLAADRKQIRTHGFDIVKTLLDTPIDDHGYLTGECSFMFDSHVILLRQEGDALSLIDYNHPRHRITLKDISMQRLKSRVLLGYLKETGEPLQNFEGLLNFRGVEFTNHRLDSTGLITVLRNHGDPAGAVLLEPVNATTLDLTALHLDKPTTMHLLRMHDQPRSVLIEYLATQRLEGNVPIDLSGIDLTRMDLSGVDLTDILLTGAHFNENLLQAVLHDDVRQEFFRRQQAQRCATRIQACFRRHRVFHQKESPEAVLTVMTTPKGMRYRVPDKTKLLGFRIVKKPPALLHPRGGAFKIKTHADPTTEGYVVLTRKTGVPEWAMKGASNREIIKLIEDQLPTFVPQYLINSHEYLSKNMGQKDLMALLMADEYQFTAAQIIQHFLGLARDLQTLHSHLIVHRDVKSENVIFKDGVMHLIDTDFMSKTAEVLYPCGSFRYFHVDLRAQFRRNAIKVDQHGFFLTMMCAIVKRSPSVTGQYSYQNIAKFVHALPCDSRRRMALASFIQAPANSTLLHPLQDYLTAPS